MFFKLIRKEKLSEGELEELLLQWGLLLGEGFSIEKSLDWLHANSQHKAVRQFCDRVIDGMGHGMSFADALCNADGLKNEWVIRIGREQPNIQRAKEMELIAAEITLAKKWKGQLSAALIYPGCVSVIGLAVILFALLYLVPQYEAVFEQMVTSGELPLLTRMLVVSGDFLGQYGLRAGLLIIVLLAMAMVGWRVFPKAGFIVKTFAMKIPWVGSWYENQRTLMFCHELSVQLARRVALADALQGMRLLRTDPCWQYLLDGLDEAVFSGQTLAAALGQRQLIKPDAVAIIAVGEASGRLSHTLERARASAAERQAVLIRRFSALIEPMMIVLLAILIGLIALALFLPLVSLVQHMGHEW